MAETGCERATLVTLRGGYRRSRRPGGSHRTRLALDVGTRRFGKLTFGVAVVPNWDYHVLVRVIAISTLKAFWEKNPDCADAKEPILAWYRYALNADWGSPVDVKTAFAHASILKDGRVIFNIAGNKYRLVVWINFNYRVVYIRFIGTHAQYDRIDAQTI